MINIALTNRVIIPADCPWHFNRTRTTTNTNSYVSVRIHLRQLHHIISRLQQAGACHISNMRAKTAERQGQFFYVFTQNKPASILIAWSQVVKSLDCLCGSLSITDTVENQGIRISISWVRTPVPSQHPLLWRGKAIKLIYSKQEQWDVFVVPSVDIN